MAKKLFITGATGYIGGDALYAIANAYPDLEITALVRNSDKGAKVASQYPKIRLVYGDLDNTELLTTEASKADVVLHTASAGRASAASAIVAGMGLKKDGEKGWVIHCSGTGTLGYVDVERNTYGTRSEKVYDDWEGISEITSLPETAGHRKTDRVILEASSQYPGKVSGAVVAPPCIYGPGRGPDNQRSIQVYDMARATLKRGKGFQLGEGKNIWSYVHVQDLSNAFLALVTEALSPNGGKATWDSEGYYFAEAGDIVWGDVAKAIAKIAKDKGLIETSDIDSVSPEEATELRAQGTYLWGTNSRSRAIRASKLFGWTPKQKGVYDLLPEIIDEEARDLGLTKGHAEKAAG